MKNVNSYRGITLLSCMGKLFTYTLNERLSNYSNAVNIINELQAVFRHHIFLLKCITGLFNWRKKDCCLFVDYKKAFDTMWHEGLWYKLVRENVKGKILMWSETCTATLYLVLYWTNMCQMPLCTILGWEKERKLATIALCFLYQWHGK